MQSDVALSKVVSHALRHEPSAYDLELDGAGWVPVADLVRALHRRGVRWRHVDRAVLERMIASSAKRRYELDGERIRALYGHSVPGRVETVEAPPPSVLYHGTSPRAWQSIAVHGLLPMGRQYVHMSADVATAREVGRRKSPTPVLLRVHARAAHAGGARFWQGNDKVWLAEEVPPEFLAVEG